MYVWVCTVRVYRYIGIVCVYGYVLSVYIGIGIVCVYGYVLSVYIGIGIVCVYGYSSSLIAPILVSWASFCRNLNPEP
jgi:hypothetical protein